MLRKFLIGLGLLFVVACSKPQDQLVGTWTVDSEALADSPEVKALEGEARRHALDIARDLMKEMSYEFRADGGLAVAFGRVRQEGTWTLKSADGDRLVLTTRMKDESADKELRVKVEKDGLEVTGPDGKSVVLRRKD